MWSEYHCEIDSQTSAFTEKLGENKNNVVKVFSDVFPFFFLFWTITLLVTSQCGEGEVDEKTFKTYHNSICCLIIGF